VFCCLSFKTFSIISVHGLMALTLKPVCDMCTRVVLFLLPSNKVLTYDLYCSQAAWLLRVASCIDLTTLAGDDTLANVQRLCFKAKQPIRQDLMAAMGLQDLGQV